MNVPEKKYVLLKNLMLFENLVKLWITKKQKMKVNFEKELYGNGPKTLQN